MRMSKLFRLLKTRLRSQKNKYLEPAIILYWLFTLLLLLLEIFVYPGVVQKHIHISIEDFLLISIVLIFVRKNSYPLFIEKIIIFFTLLLAPITIYLSFEEQIHFPNFVFSQYHISLIPLQYLLSFFFVQTVAILNRKKSFIKWMSSISFSPKPKYKTLMLLLFSAIFSFFLVQNNFNAKFGIIDDSDIAYFLGSDKKISLSEFPRIILSTEVGNFGSTLRYRPAYYIMKVTESSIWKDNPHLWYFARYAILTLFLFLLSYIISNFLGIVPAIIFSLFVMTGAYWSGVWARLGPSEIYMVLGLSLYSFGLLRIIEADMESIFPWLLFLLGGLVAIGSKENMVILAIPSLCLLIYRIIHRKLDWKLIIPILHILLALLISVGIYLAISKTGHDFYDNQIGTGGSLALVLRGIIRTIKDFKIVEIILIGLFLLVSKIIVLGRINLKEFFSRNIKTIVLLIFLCFVYFTQFVFYSGGWPNGTRYDFPGILAKQLFWLICFYLLAKLLLLFNSNKSKPILLQLNIIFFGLLLISVVNTGYYPLIKASENNALITSTFTRNLGELSDLAKGYPGYPLVLKSESTRDYEAVFSLERFTRFMGVSNLIYLDYKDVNLEKRSGLEKQLSETLTQISKNGTSGNGTLFNQFDPKKIGTNCILVILSGVGDDNECVLKARIN